MEHGHFIFAVNYLENFMRYYIGFYTRHPEVMQQFGLIGPSWMAYSPAWGCVHCRNLMKRAD